MGTWLEYLIISLFFMDISTLEDETTTVFRKAGPAPHPRKSETFPSISEWRTYSDKAAGLTTEVPEFDFQWEREIFVFWLPILDLKTSQIFSQFRVAFFCWGKTSGNVKLTASVWNQG